MNDEQRRAIIAEVAAMIEPPEPPAEDEFTVKEYATQLGITTRVAGIRLKKAMEQGVITGRRTMVGRRPDGWAFRMVEPCED